MTISSPSEKSPSASADKLPGNDTREDVDSGSLEAGLERTLSSRHLQFIAIGGAIGTGLFLGTGSALAKAGPVSLLIAFIFIGSVVYSVMVALGEMAAYLPVPGAFAVYATRFVDPTLGFSMGWVYWFNWAITYALELTAAGVIIQYWNSSLNTAIWIAVFWVIFTGINCLPVRWIGEFEMWFSSIKVVTIVGFIIYSICVNAGVGDEGYIGFKYWRDPGPFAEHVVTGNTGKFVGFWAVLVTAAFSYQGTELVGIAAGEAQNPSKTIPSAIRWTFWGIFCLFISTVFMLGINVPYTDDALNSSSQDASASPLVIIAKRAGVPVLAHIINAVLLTAVLTAANSNVYSSSRILVSLAEEGHAPKLFKKTNKLGTPYYAVAASSVIGFLGFLNLSSGGASAFNWLLSIGSVAGLISWSLTNVCHIRFMQALEAQNIPRRELPYVAPFQPYLSWFGLFFNVLITLTNGFTVFIEWDTSEFFTAYISVILFVVLYVGHKLWYRTKVVPLAEVNLSRGSIDG
ncbi:unnamed protein product [Clonostachys rosea f. rosea IK726]|jgi:amino acid transporter|uniref:Amino acid permease/ SLC12A domain-containing protein n=2 Tax=Bionectria ochroleuca TaxID=29856 RepID=A0A0B7K6F1_BIOOC|nr:unnamed protein product [Clonostachys rosea f. rosea IK726]